MDIKIIVALIGLTGVGASTLIQYYLGRRNEKTKKAIDIRAQAYLDLVNTVSEIASSAKHDEKRNLEQLQQLTQAKTRVVLIGSDDVVNEIHQFFTNYGALNTEGSFNAFSNIVAAMRSDLSGNNNLSSRVLSEALFGK
ncbi:hypothetical protein MHM98_06865 [Psychrobium sp. MM17-31]|uniref:hypothetical protein n=1 Tax=Psychrobium sp. MM17-31 TaxID=2917758 RepID=UPI001EF43EF4|nr:hypothetical protein [Psychrobium sp. MM17-31]MCG7531070.1 hypothetical protein [Psychrobium sp. MM17-31]